ncbi:paraneoplastic antigen Ma2-like [Haliotis cracherodii]|uniref:paraneoplastic antigen Ma2-like n=1 Tax=Haliotis cracherodii TaxID=6455 RepID=UPI0039E82C0E
MELTGDELKNIVLAFKKLGVKPKADTQEDFATWMNEYSAVESEGESKEGIAQATAPQPPSGMPTYMYQKFPRLPNFSGAKSDKDTSYEVWRYHVDCLINNKVYSSDAKDQAIRVSLKGEAAKIAVHMQPDASTTDLLRKFKSVFGVVERRECSMALFYSARQEEKEDVSVWSCRLEELLSRAMRITLWTYWKHYVKSRQINTAPHQLANRNRPVPPREPWSLNQN